MHVQTARRLRPEKKNPPIRRGRSRGRRGAKRAARNVSDRDDDEDEEAIAEAPRKKRREQDYDDEEDNDRPSRARNRDREEVEDDDDRPRPRRSRDDEDDAEEDDRPRKKSKKRRGEYADCPNCGCRGKATKVGFTWWGGIIGPRLFSHVRCNRCGTCYNGKTGNYNTTAIAIYVGAAALIGIIVAILGIIAETR